MARKIYFISHQRRRQQSLKLFFKQRVHTEHLTKSVEIMWVVLMRLMWLWQRRFNECMCSKSRRNVCKEKLSENGIGPDWKPIAYKMLSLALSTTLLSSSHKELYGILSMFKKRDRKKYSFVISSFGWKSKASNKVAVKKSKEFFGLLYTHK